MSKATEISLKESKENKLFYFVANVVIYRESDKRCLILKRHTREKVHPGVYAVPGGKLEWSDLNIQQPTRMNGDVIDFENAVEKLLAREVKEEANIEIGSKIYFINDVAFVRPDGIPVILIKFAAKYKSGDVKLEEDAFTDYAWVNAQEVLDYPCINGVQEEVNMTIKLFESMN